MNDLTKILLTIGLSSAVSILSNVAVTKANVSALAKSIDKLERRSERTNERQDMRLTSLEIAQAKISN